MRILIANRGEIARRIIRTAHRMGHETVAVYAEPDANAPYVGEATLSVPIGPASLADSYLSIERIMTAIAESQAHAVHPGYGFLSENAVFAQTCVQRGIIWIGPSPAIIGAMGSKIEARKIAEQVGVPTIPGWSESQNPGELAQAAARIGYPVLVKASAGGGGKGIRIAHRVDEFASALDEASTEAERAFGDGDVIVERYIERPRHVEVQIVGDKHGNVIELGTRECSVQRRYQKLLEEAPAPNLPDETRHGIRRAARMLGQAVRYDSAGTVEFIVDDATGEFFFLEMNTRLQVEHPVTELITGLDLVEAMVRSAAGEALSGDVVNRTFTGHAIEARILAEDTANQFAPQTGMVHQVQVPEGVRWDTGIEPGSEITPFYDSMVAKLIVHGASRDQALAKMRTALEQLIIDGPTTTAGFHRWLLDQEAMTSGWLTTRFLDETQPLARPGEIADASVRLKAAQSWAADARLQHDGTSPWLGSSFSITPTIARATVGLLDAGGGIHEVTVVGSPEMAQESTVAAAVDRVGRRVAVNRNGYTHGFAVPPRTERWAPSITTRKGSGDAIVAPFPAVVSEVAVAAGDEVEGDQVLVVIEAMKMLHSLRATGASTIEQVRVAAGDQIATGDVLVTFAQPESTEQLL